MNNSTLQAALFEALDAIRAGYPEQAVTACNELLAVYPDSVRVYRVRAQAYEGMEDWRHASEDFSRVLDIVPTDAHAIVSLARTMNQLGRTEEAQLIARQALDYAPTDEDALALAQNIDDSDTAALKPPQPGRVLMMRQQFDFGRVGRALESLRKFAAERPHRIDARTVLAELLWRSHARIAAAELCQQILDEQPDSLPANTLLAIIWAKLGATRISEAHLRTLDRLDPDHRETREWLGDLSPVTVADVPARPPIKDASINVGVGDARESDTDHDVIGGIGTGVEIDPQDAHDPDVGADDAEHDNYVNDFIVNVGPISPNAPVARLNARQGHTAATGNRRDRDELDSDDIIEEFSPLEWERETDEDADEDEDDVDDVIDGVDREDLGDANAIDTAEQGDAIEAPGNQAVRPIKPSWLKDLRKAGPPAPEGAPLIDSTTVSKPLTHFKFESASNQATHEIEIEAGVEAEEIDDLATGDIETEDETLAKTELSMLPVTPNALLDTVELETSVDSTVDSGRVTAESIEFASVTSKETPTSLKRPTKQGDDEEAEKVVIIAPADREARTQRTGEAFDAEPPGTAHSRPERRIQQQSAGLN